MGSVNLEKGNVNNLIKGRYNNYKCCCGNAMSSGYNDMINWISCTQHLDLLKSI